MTVAELIAALAKQPPNAQVLIATGRSSFGDADVNVREGFTFAGDAPGHTLSVPIFHADDINDGDSYRAVVAVGRP